MQDASGAYQAVRTSGKAKLQGHGAGLKAYATTEAPTAVVWLQHLRWLMGLGERTEARTFLDLPRLLVLLASAGTFKHSCARYCTWPSAASHPYKLAHCQQGPAAAGWGASTDSV